MKPTVYLAADHAGFGLKESVKKALTKEGYHVVDKGNTVLDNKDDYPAFALAAAKAVASASPRAIGILACGNAEGVCIVANKVRRVRAAIGYSSYAAKTARTDDDANVLCLPGRVLTVKQALAITRKFLHTEFSGAARHTRRLKQVKRIERSV